MDRIIEQITQAKQRSQEPYCGYIYDLVHLREHASGLMSNLPSFCRLFYALKANSAEPIISALASIVDGFEVASLGEVMKVRAVSADIPIIYGGPVKTDKDITGALLHQVQRIHVESSYELMRVAKIAQELGLVVSILLRVNVSSPLPDATLFMAGEHSQFGIDENQIADVIGLAQSLESVRLEGFHLHSLSNNLNWERHVALVSHYCDLVAKWSKDYGLHITYLNAGGGIGVNYGDLQEQFNWNSFIDGLNGEVERKLPEGLTIMFECGRYLTASCGYYAAEIVDVKSNHGNRFALIRGGTHHFRLPSSWGHNHPFQIVPIEAWHYPFPRPELGAGPVTVAGELCTPKDVLARDCYIPGARIGDVLVFLFAGAYGWAISHHDFLSHPHPTPIYLD